MRAVTKLHPTEQAYSFDTFLSALDNPATAFAVTPRTLRGHVGVREFGDFGTVLRSIELPPQIERPADTKLTIGEWLAVIAVGAIMWTAIFAGLFS